MNTVLLIIHLFVTLALIGVVLIQRSEGGGLGVGSSQGMGSFMSGRGTANLLTRTTAILATVFMLLALALAVLNRGANAPGHSLLDIHAPLPAAPPPPAPGSSAAPKPAPTSAPAVAPAAPASGASPSAGAHAPAAETPAPASHAPESPAPAKSAPATPALPTTAPSAAAPATPAKPAAPSVPTN